MRGLAPPCPECAQGLTALCRHTTDGDVSAGLQTGFCRDTGGGWSEGLVAHTSQLHAIPDDLPDEDAVLVEPLACALHAAQIADVQPGEHVAIIGAGTIGLLTLAAVRESAPAATLICVAKHAGQQTAARRFGADDVCAPDRLYVEGARITNSRRLVGHGNREMLLGGFDRVLDCVGSGASIEQAVTITRPRGRVVLVGMPGEVKADLAAAWLRELELRGAYGYEHDFPAAIEFAQDAEARPPDRSRLAAARVQEGARPGAQGRARRPREDRLRGRRVSIAPTRMIERTKRRQPAAEREACVVEVHENSPPTLFHSGESFRLERLPVGSRIVYPPPPLKGLIDVDAAISAALDSPLGMDPLDSLLRAGMKLTIAFDDISLPLPPMKTPDIRGRVIEHVLERAYRAGVDDIHLIAALALHRRMTPAELKRAVGPRVFDEFYPDRLYNHDAEDPDEIVSLGETRHGEAVELSKRAAESDLLVYVNINIVTMDGGHKSVAIGLGTYNSLRAHHTVHALRHSRSFMDPSKSELHRSAGRQGEIVEAAVPIFHIETTLNNDMYDGPLAFLAKPEARWTPREQTTFAALKRTTDRMSPKLRRAAFHKSAAPYAVTGVTAGAVSPVHDVTLEHCAAQQAVGVRGQADVVTAGLPYLGPYNVNSILNPILVMCMGLGYFFNLYQGVPLVREGGVMIFTHPVNREFHPVHHPSYVDFYEEILSETTDPVEIEQRFERSYAEDEWYRHLYRTSYAYHGVHPFYMWYWGAHALQHLGDVIFVGGDPQACRRLGFRRADTMRDALEMAEQVVGRDPSLTHFHCPPLFYAQVEA